MQSLTSKGSQYIRQIVVSHQVVSDSFVTPWTVTAQQSPLFMGLPRQEYWSGLPFLSPRGLPNPGIEPEYPALAGRFLAAELPGKPIRQIHNE